MRRVVFHGTPLDAQGVAIGRKSAGLYGAHMRKHVMFFILHSTEENTWPKYPAKARTSVHFSSLKYARLWEFSERALSFSGDTAENFLPILTSRYCASFPAGLLSGGRV